MSEIDSNSDQVVKESAPNFTFEDAEKFVKSVNDDPTRLYREPEDSKKNLHSLL